MKRSRFLKRGKNVYLEPWRSYSENVAPRTWMRWSILIHIWVTHSLLPVSLIAQSVEGLAGVVKTVGSIATDTQSFFPLRAQCRWHSACSIENVPAHAHDGPLWCFQVPTMAVLGSGGGYRAMTALSAAVKALAEIKVLDCSTYIAGLSGSAW